ncbi:MAG TPA: YceI family protein [Gaiellaceae bacterium]|nr:YceI family protein [Gaiellaceae bacterium]
MSTITPETPLAGVRSRIDRLQTPTRWFVDSAESDVEFAVRTYWGLATVRGRFERFEGTYEVGPAGTKIELRIDADSLDTGNQTRDKHLRSDDFFGVDEHPEVRFTSTRVVHIRDGTLHVEGNLDAAGKVVPLEFDATVVQAGAVFELETTTTVDQRQLGLSSGPFGMIRPPTTVHVRARLGGTEHAVAHR